MDRKKLPDWLIEVQNKSWEPEIIISGITLTFVFILSNYIYNFFGMLVQDFGVFDAIAKTMYRISVIAITGLKIILIVHLILRGLWTGIIGLSYVFPKGVKEEKLPKSQRNIIFDSPDILVIKLEKICSILFSFIFSSIWAGIAVFLYFIPLIILFLTGLDIYYISIISSVYTLMTFVLIISFSIFYNTKLKNSKIRQKLENSIFENILTIYFTNIGKGKTLLIFFIYFLVIISISLSDISKFVFDNQTGADTTSVSKIININNDLYESLRDQNLRIFKATINQFQVTDNELRLFIAFYEEDTYTIQELQNNFRLYDKFEINTDSINISLPDLYKISIDDKKITGLKWYSIENKYTGQKGIITTIPLDNFEKKYHELKIDKMYWNILRKKMILIDNWDIIPFETANKK